MHICAEHFYTVFSDCVRVYHKYDDINRTSHSEYPPGSLDNTLYSKCWIDTVQWHLEDIIRDKDIDPATALSIKRRIDLLNQQRTDIVELIDDHFVSRYSYVVPQKQAILNTESIGWAIDRLSILALKLFHMDVEVNRPEASEYHIRRCLSKRDILTQQLKDLLKALNLLMEGISEGRILLKVYRQMKMYNEIELNPVLYRQKVRV